MSKFLNLMLKIMAGLALISGFGFLAIQFVPVEKSNPPVVSEPKWDSPQTKALAERACYDCHSNQTKWPWYANVAPASWLVAHDVQEGRAKLNFSEVNKGGEGVETDEIIEEVEEGVMPPRNYVTMHPEARLTDAEMEALISGLKATFGSGAEEAMVK